MELGLLLNLMPRCSGTCMTGRIPSMGLQQPGIPHPSTAGMILRKDAEIR